MSICARLVLALTGLIGSAGVLADKRPLTVVDAIQTARFATTFRAYGYDPAGTDLYTGKQPVFVSPDGSRYVAMLVRGDMDRNGVWAELVSGDLNSLESAACHRTIARFFTHGKGAGSRLAHTEGSTELTIPNRRLDTFPFTWIDSSHVALLWENSEGIKQVVRVDVATGATAFITHHRTDVTSFAVSRSGGLIYSASVATTPNRSRQMWREGFAVAQDEIASVLLGDVDPALSAVVSDAAEIFLVRSAQEEPRRIAIGTVTPQVMQFSPNGKLAIVSAGVTEPRPEWRSYTDSHLNRVLDLAHQDQTRWMLSGSLQQLFLLDVESGERRPLWDVPLRTGRTPQISWSPGSESIVMGPTFLPVEGADAAGLAGTAFVELDLNTGRYAVVPLATSGESGAAVDRMQWMSSALLRVSRNDETLYFEKYSRGWRRRTDVPRDVDPPHPPRMRVELREDVNTPPALYAITDKGLEKKILDPNPGLAEFALGYVERIAAVHPDGWPWTGRLYYPVGYRPDTRYPLVIQLTRTNAGNEYSLYGPGGGGLGPSRSIYAAQMLANRQIAVLQLESIESKRLPNGTDPAGILDTPREADIEMKTYEAAIDYLTKRGLVDPGRVGLAGFSRTGWHVEYALSHSEFPYAAAIASDNIDGSYMQEMLMGLIAGSGKNGAAPVGDGLATWLERAPGFNAHKVRAPLRLQAELCQLAILFHWEMFSQLKRLNKPVELYVIPEIEQGSHELQNPAQVLAAKQGAVDWFDFWLNGHEDPDPKKAEQYQRWRVLRILRD